jgi:hypothetical protein
MFLVSDKLGSELMYGVWFSEELLNIGTSAQHDEAERNLIGLTLLVQVWTIEMLAIGEEG